MASSRHDNLPRYPSIVSRNEDWKVEGVSTISVRVLVPGTWYPQMHSCSILILEHEICVYIVDRLEKIKIKSNIPQHQGTLLPRVGWSVGKAVHTAKTPISDRSHARFFFF